MNERALITLGLLAACTARGGPGKSMTRLHEKMRDYQAREPANAIVLTVLGAAAAFYVAERGRNPKVTSFYDALVYAATNLSVGYSDIFAKTPGGKAVGSLLMTYGPALAARALDAPGAPVPAPAPTAAGASGDTGAMNNAAVERIVASLDAILNELRARPA
jgi:voltage-gated potassium channel